MTMALNQKVSITVTTWSLYVI